MKTDKELLELAAKAYGVEVDYRHGSGAFYYDDENTGREEWDPLDDDGQALRLAVKLRFWIQNRGSHVDVAYSKNEGGFHVLSIYDEPVRQDALAATRRAIVQAAAAIGEKL